MMINKLKVLLASKDTTIKDMVKDTGLSRNTISNIVNNPTANISNSSINAICIFLGCTPDELFEYHPITLNKTIIDIDTDTPTTPTEYETVYKTSMFLEIIKNSQIINIELSGNTTRIDYYSDNEYKFDISCNLDFSTSEDLENYNNLFNDFSDRFKSFLNQLLYFRFVSYCKNEKIAHGLSDEVRFNTPFSEYSERNLYFVPDPD